MSVKKAFFLFAVGAEERYLLLLLCQSMSRFVAMSRAETDRASFAKGDRSRADRVFPTFVCCRSWFITGLPQILLFRLRKALGRIFYFKCNVSTTSAVSKFDEIVQYLEYTYLQATCGVWCLGFSK